MAFSNDMKNAKVIPIYKAGERNLFSNYRPVSLLPQFSKILERLFSNRLIDFIEKKDVAYYTKANMDSEIICRLRQLL